MVLLAGGRAQEIRGGASRESMQAEDHAGAVGSSASIPPEYGINPLLVVPTSATAHAAQTCVTACLPGCLHACIV